MPRIDTLVKLAGGLGVDAAVLLEGIDWTEGSATTTPGAFTFPGRAERRAETRNRAASFRAQHSKGADPAELAREAGEELEKRGERWQEDES